MWTVATLQQYPLAFTVETSHPCANPRVGVRLKKLFGLGVHQTGWCLQKILVSVLSERILISGRPADSLAWIQGEIILDGSSSILTPVGNKQIFTFWLQSAVSIRKVAGISYLHARRFSLCTFFLVPKLRPVARCGSGTLHSGDRSRDLSGTKRGVNSLLNVTLSRGSGFPLSVKWKWSKESVRTAIIIIISAFLKSNATENGSQPKVWTWKKTSESE